MGTSKGTVETWFFTLLLPSDTCFLNSAHNGDLYLLFWALDSGISLSNIPRTSYHYEASSQ